MSRSYLNAWAAKSWIVEAASVSLTFAFMKQRVESSIANLRQVAVPW